MFAHSGGPLHEILETVAKCLNSLYGVSEDQFLKLISEPPKKELGDLGFPLLRFVKNPSIESILECIDKKRNYVELRVEGGFLNIYLKEEVVGRELARLYSEGVRLGVIKTRESKRITVEHTSANPVHPLHMGHARNACLGDSIARMLSSRGHKVVRRFYINDMGRQVAVLALGFKIIGMSPEELSDKLKLKIDHAAGWLYAVTHTAIDLRDAKKIGDENRVLELASVLSNLKDKGDPSLADRVIDYVLSSENPEREISEIMKRYERGLEPEKTMIRKISEAVLKGFQETLSKLYISFDYWDWESDIVWSGLLAEVLEELLKSKYIISHKDAKAVDVMRVLKEAIEKNPEVVEKLKIPTRLEIPPMILMRSDGTTLYWTRDIAYSLFKFKNAQADMVVNVVGAEQKLPQLQIRLALMAIERVREALNMIHYDYEIVRLPGTRMSGRRGEYVTLDSVIDEVRTRALREVRLRNPSLSEEEARLIAEKVACGAIRFALIQAGATKPIVFDVEKALDFEANSGPYLQYSYARACNILAKHGPVDYGAVNPSAFKNEARRELLLLALRFPIVATKAIDELRPEDLASFLIRLADSFNKWYEKDSVIREPDYGTREAKALLVEIIKDVMKEGLEVLGIPPLERM
ncbi:MAG: arginine--tRNA ligase [Acidilobaceae archaeon]